MEVAQTREVMMKHFPSQKPQAFVCQPEQFRAHRIIAVAHAVEQLLQLAGSIFRHAVIFPYKGRPVPVDGQTGDSSSGTTGLYGVYRDRASPPSSPLNLDWQRGAGDSIL